MAQAVHQTSSDWDFWTEGLDRDFFRRVYTRSAIIGVLAALVFAGMDQRLISLGLVSGLAVGLFSAWTAEVTVRLLFRGGSFPGVKLAVAGVVKLPILLGGLLLIAWASINGHMNVFGVVAGVLLVHATMLVLVIGTALAAEDKNRDRYR
jgi:hypothetical protein